MTDIYISWGLLMLPLVSLIFARKIYPQRRCMVLGISLGSVISPIGLGIYYAGYMIPFIGILLVLFVPITAMHGAAGLGIAKYLNLSHSKGLNIEVELINGLIWGSFYGFLGLLIDKLRNRSEESEPQQTNKAPGNSR